MKFLNNITTRALKVFLCLPVICSLEAHSSNPAPLEGQESLSEGFWQDLEGAVSIPMGEEDRPVLYLVMDPSCRFCMKYLETLRHEVARKTIQVRVILVAFLSPQSLQAGGVILSSKDPLQELLGWINNPGRPEGVAYPPEGDVAIDRNNSILMRWGITATPLSVFRMHGKIHVMEGAPADPGIFRKME